MLKCHNLIQAVVRIKYAKSDENFFEVRKDTGWISNQGENERLRYTHVNSTFPLFPI